MSGGKAAVFFVAMSACIISSSSITPPKAGCRYLENMTLHSTWRQRRRGLPARHSPYASPKMKAAHGKLPGRRRPGGGCHAGKAEACRMVDIVHHWNVSTPTIRASHHSSQNRLAGAILGA